MKRFKKQRLLLESLLLIVILACCGGLPQSPIVEENIGVDIQQTVDRMEEEPPTKEMETPLQGEEQTEPVSEPPKQEQTTCFLSVRCENALAFLDEEKRKILPQDGVILAEQEAEFHLGESVFHLLVREMKRNKIHLEFQSVPFYNSAYVEGIANLYEFECGELSGWMYCVNGEFPNYGCSNYQLKSGDRVEWVYTCDLGRDVGGEESARNGREYE